MHLFEDDCDWILRYLRNAEFVDEDYFNGILCFVLIWSIFEGRICNQKADVPKFEEIVVRLNQHGKLTNNIFTEQISYFRTRYVTNGIVNSNFSMLRLKNNNRPDFVEDVLKNVNTDATNVLLALMIIIYRLRNNLFHGIKSLDSIGRQLENFRHANVVLRQILKWEDISY